MHQDKVETNHKEEEEERVDIDYPEILLAYKHAKNQHGCAKNLTAQLETFTNKLAEGLAAVLEVRPNALREYQQLRAGSIRSLKLIHRRLNNLQQQTEGTLEIYKRIVDRCERPVAKRQKTFEEAEQQQQQVTQVQQQQQQQTSQQ